MFSAGSVLARLLVVVSYRCRACDNTKRNWMMWIRVEGSGPGAWFRVQCVEVKTQTAISLTIHGPGAKGPSDRRLGACHSASVSVCVRLRPGRQGNRPCQFCSVPGTDRAVASSVESARCAVVAWVVVGQWQWYARCCTSCQRKSFSLASVCS